MQNPRQLLEAHQLHPKKSLGQNFEVRLRWNTNSILKVELGYARFFKGSYPGRVPESTGTDDSNFFYISTDIRARILPY